jgi:hypothetical protein
VTTFTVTPMPAQNQLLTIRDLYPHLSEAQQKEAEENLDRYFELVLRICERIRLEAEEDSSIRSCIR